MKYFWKLYYYWFKTPKHIAALMRKNKRLGVKPAAKKRWPRPIRVMKTEELELGPRANQFDEPSEISQEHKKDIEIDRKLQTPKNYELELYPEY